MTLKIKSLLKKLKSLYTYIYIYNTYTYIHYTVIYITYLFLDTIRVQNLYLIFIFINYFLFKK